MDLGEVLVGVFSILITAVTYLLSGILKVQDYGKTYYPQTWQYLMSILYAYLIYKFIRRALRFWYNLVVSMVKMLLLFLFITISLYVYVRGWNLFTRDLKLLQAYLSSNSNPSFSSGSDSWQKVLFSNIASRFWNGDPGTRGFSGSILEDYGIDVDPSFFETFNENMRGKSVDDTYEEVHHFVQENVEHISDFFQQQGLDLNGVRNNIMNVLNNNR